MPPFTNLNHFNNYRKGTGIAFNMGRVISD